MQLPDVKNLDIFTIDAILGQYPQQFNCQVLIGLFNKFLDSNPKGKYFVATDMRASSDEMLAAVVNYASEKSIELVYLPLAPFDYFRFAIRIRNAAGGIWIGAAKGPESMNGVRFVNNLGQVIDHNTLRNYEVIKANASNIDISTLKQDSDLLKDYFFAAIKDVNPLLWNDFRIVVDGGNGLGGNFLSKLLAKIPQLKSIFINPEPVASFPHHFPNPLIVNNNSHAVQKVLQSHAGLGICLDQDGDSFVLIDETGKNIPPAVTSAVITEIILKKVKKGKIGHDYNQVYAIEKAIYENSGQNVPLKNDYATLSRLATELSLDLTATSDGIYLFKEMNYAPSPFHALLLIVEYLSNNKTTFSQLVAKYLESFSFSTELTFIISTNSNWADFKNIITSTFHDAAPRDNTDLVFENEHYRISINNDRSVFVRIYLEASSELLLQEIQLKLLTKLQDIAKFTAGLCEEIDLDTIDLSNKKKFSLLLENLWFTWNPHYILPIIDMYGDGWRKNMPPEALVANYGKDKLNEILSNKEWELSENLRLFKQYLAAPKLFDREYAKDAKFLKLKTNPIAYFCMEFGLVDWLQIYSGGLGILAGDYMKASSDMGVPVVGIGIFYHQGYLHQDFSPDGAQIESYIHQQPMDYDMELVRDKKGNPLLIDVAVDGHSVKVRAWKQKIGVNNLYLLDTNFEANEEWEDRLITGYLYGGDIENRIRQEIVLGIAGARLLEEIDIHPAVYHMNEGHSGFLVIERTRVIMKAENCSFEEALKKAGEKLVFTNHTLKEAGNDIFDFMLFEKYLSPYLADIKTDINTLFSLGDDKVYSQGGFSMTIFGFKHAKVSNAVSKLHANAAKNVWKDHELVPVTNGVHMPTWVSPEIHTVLDKHLSEAWHLSQKNIDYSKIQNIPAKELWHAHQQRKEKLISSLNNELGLELNSDYLTIAWSRRLAAYKRPDLLLSDVERLERIINNSQRPVQILIAGKSHPKDTIGKQILQKMNNIFNDNRFHNKIEIIPGYNWQLARRMVSGADIWLNTPYRFEEACGTSGMKAAANGVLQFTTLDGWTDEVDWFQKGWIISETDTAHSLYENLEKNILPMYYNKNSDGYNEDWIAMMLNSIQLGLEHFSSERMLHDYLRNVYSQIL